MRSTLHGVVALVAGALLMLAGQWFLLRTVPADSTGAETNLVTPVPTGEVVAWQPWVSRDSAGVTSWCVSNASIRPFPPVTQP